jgi:hypothetical protein
MLDLEGRGGGRETRSMCKECWATKHATNLLQKQSAVRGNQPKW